MLKDHKQAPTLGGFEKLVEIHVRASAVIILRQ